MNSTLATLFISIFLGACGQILLKFATHNMGESNLAWPSIPYALMRIFWNGWALSAIFCFVASMVLWIKVIASMELSRAYPSVSISYIMVFLFSVLFFKEAVSGSKLLGFSMILAGVFFLHR